MADAKLERLLNLTAALLYTERPLTAEELRQRVPGYPQERASFRRQFERDKDALREMGVPLSMEEVADPAQPVQGYRILAKDYYLPDAGLTEDELAALHLAARAVRIEDDVQLGGLWKLGGTPAEGLDEYATAEARLPSDPNLQVLFAAVTDHRVVRIMTGGVAREVRPARLRFTRGRWYLLGYDLLRSESRTYRLDRIEAPVEPVGPPGAFAAIEVETTPLEPWLIGVEDPIEVRVQVDAALAAVARQTLQGAEVEKVASDGSVVLRVLVTNPDGFRGWLLDLLEHAVVLSPAAVRDEVIEWLRSCAGEDVTP